MHELVTISVEVTGQNRDSGKCLFLFVRVRNGKMKGFTTVVVSLQLINERKGK